MIENLLNHEFNQQSQINNQQFLIVRKVRGPLRELPHGLHRPEVRRSSSHWRTRDRRRRSSRRRGRHPLCPCCGGLRDNGHRATRAKKPRPRRRRSTKRSSPALRSLHPWHCSAPSACELPRNSRCVLRNSNCEELPPAAESSRLNGQSRCRARSVPDPPPPAPVRVPARKYSRLYLET